jgi:hypothetical protein
VRGDRNDCGHKGSEGVGEYEVVVPTGSFSEEEIEGVVASFSDSSEPAYGEID